jgi:hypothetical protein
MTRIVFTVLAAALTLSSGCKKQSSEGGGSGATAGSGSTAGSATGSSGAAATPDTSAGSGTMAAPAAGSGSAAAAAGSGSAAAAAAGSGSAAAGGSGSAAAAEMTHRAGMCPSTVLGAATKEAVKGKAVVVTIESVDKDAIKAIQRRTDELLAEKKTHAPTGTGHDRKGTHGGGQGLCPVYVPEGAAAKAAHVAKGVVVTITPNDKPDELAKEIDGRIAKAADWVKANIKDGDKGNQGGVGGGKGDDGSNHSGKGDGKGHERKRGNGGGGGKGTGGGGGGGTGGGGDKPG